MKKGILGFVFAIVIFGLSSVSSFAATGTVTAGSAKVREKASADSTVVASTSKGTKVDIVGAEKDSSGTVWYKVPVSGGSYGYVRSDLVETSDTISVTDNSQSSSSSSSKPEATVPTAIGEQAATVSCDTNVTVRSGASTKHDAVTSLPNGTEITLIGEANDSSGNKWYQLRCEYNGKTIEGYIRSDLIEIASGSSTDSTESTDATGDETEGTEGTDTEITDGTEGTAQEGMTEGDTEEEVVEEPVEEEHNDYEVVYMEDTENPGTGTYYLYNNIDGTMADVEVLFSTVTTANDNISKLESEASQKNILIIVLAAVVVVLLIVMTILIIKLKGAYEYEYDDEDEDEDEEEFEEPEPRRARRRVREEAEAEEEERPRRQERSSRGSRSEEQERPVRREREREENSERRGRASDEGESTVRKPSRKSQNFLTDDDEFEFEFLNMDDKDL